MDPSKEFEDTTLAYDLRLFYAVIAGKKMMAIEEATRRRDYVDWFENLELMFPVVFARVDKNRVSYKQQYVDLLKETLQILVKHRDCYLKKKTDEKGVAEIKEALLKLQHFIYRLLHLSSQFGSTSNLRGLY